MRARVKELSKREYAIEGGGSALDNVLLFIPNEQITGFIHEHDPALIEDAMGQQIVMCSPLTLFAFLGVIRQAHDNFMIEQTSDEILQLIGKFGTQWSKYADQIEKIKRRFEGVEKDFEALAGTRRRALERPLRELEAIRQQRNLPVDGELFALEADPRRRNPAERQRPASRGLTLRLRLPIGRGATLMTVSRALDPTDPTALEALHPLATSEVAVTDALTHREVYTARGLLTALVHEPIAADPAAGGDRHVWRGHGRAARPRPRPVPRPR